MRAGKEDPSRVQAKVQLGDAFEEIPPVHGAQVSGSNDEFGDPAVDFSNVARDVLYVREFPLCQRSSMCLRRRMASDSLLAVGERRLFFAKVLHSYPPVVDTVPPLAEREDHHRLVPLKVVVVDDVSEPVVVFAEVRFDESFLGLEGFVGSALPLRASS